MNTILASAMPPEALPADGQNIRAPDKHAALSRIKLLKNKRNPYIERWKAIRDYELPFLGEFDDIDDETDKGRRRDLAISNGVAWLANQAFAAGIMSGLTPPSRQWFKFDFSSDQENIEAERLLDERQAIVEAVLHRSNFYNTIHACYTELPFGQAPIAVFPSPESGVRFQAFTIGSYYIDTSAGNRINTFARKIKMNADQIVQQFGKDHLPRNVQDAFNTPSRRYDMAFDVWWLVMPNDSKRNGPSNKDMPFVSLYWVDGLEKKTKVMTADEKRSIALHEAGHATISWFCQYANPLIKVTIVPRGQALGAAWYLPEERQITTKEQMLDEMCSLMGGRAAEELFTGHISSGAMNDLERATKSAYGMVAYLGMSKTLPNICYYNQSEYSFQRPYSETTAREIDEEVLKMVNEQYTRAKNILMEHKEGHNALAELLIQKEVIMAEDVEKIFGKRPWMSRSQEIMEDEQPKIDDTVKELPEVQAAIKEHEENNKNAEEKQDESHAEDKQDDNN